MGQIKNKFDIVTLKKMLKSAALLAAGYIGGDGGLSLIEYLKNVELGKYKVPAVIACTFIVNGVREYMAGKDIKKQ